MVTHIVTWKFKDEITEDQKPMLKKAMAKNLEGLVGKVPGLLTLKFVAEMLPTSTHDIALVATLNSAEDILVYAKHPDHVKVADTYVRPFVKDRACLDY